MAVGCRIKTTEDRHNRKGGFMGVGMTTRVHMPGTRILIAALAAVVLGGVAVATFTPQGSDASSHREAPFIATDPTADGTDLYAFVSPDNEETVTFVADYIPLQEPAGGPNFHSFGPDVRYQIQIDNDGDARPDIRYQFLFKSKRLSGDTFLYNTNQVGSVTDPDLNVLQTYTVTRVKNGKRKVLGENIPVAPANIGPRSTPNYGSVEASAIANLSNGHKVFAGPRDDPFYVDLGSIFDLGGLRPFNEAHLIPLAAESGVDGVAGYNTHSMVIQVPKAQLTASGDAPEGVDDPDAVVGVWTTAERRRIRVLTASGRPRSRGDWVQVSRLGLPLVNEVLIPLKDKNKWNASKPKDDGQFLEYVTDPELGRLIPVLYPGVETPPPPRNDLVTVALTGIPDLNQPADVVPSEQLRLNMTVPATPFADQDRLGLLAGQNDGFPNGRRLGDDVTDILIRAIAGGYPFSPDFNVEPNNLLGDGVDANDLPFTSTFPYVAAPHQGYSHTHHGQLMGP
jgi:hypothetical protein